MNVDAKPIVVTQAYPVAPEIVWQALTDEQQMPQWFFDTIETFEPRVGFETVFVVVANGDRYIHRWTVTEVVPQQRISYRWRYDGIPGDSVVTWELSPTASGTELTLTHAGGETFPQNNPVFFRETGVEGWTYFLQDSLKSFLDKRDVEFDPAVEMVVASLVSANRNTDHGVLDRSTQPPTHQEPHRGHATLHPGTSGRGVRRGR